MRARVLPTSTTLALGGMRGTVHHVPVPCAASSSAARVLRTLKYSIAGSEAISMRSSGLRVWWQSSVLFAKPSSVLISLALW